MVRAGWLRMLGLAVMAAACASPGPTAVPSRPPAPTERAHASPAVPPGTPSSAPTASLGPGATPATRADWERSGSLAASRGSPSTVLLGDGRVLVVGYPDVGYPGHGGSECVRPDSGTTEVWSPATGAWTPGPSLNAPRAEFVAVRLGDGSALVTGGVSAGTFDAEMDEQTGHQSFSSTYVFDPSSEPPAWVKKGLLHQARTLPSATALLDGRVLVAGGYYLSGKEAIASGRLASYRASPSSGGIRIPPRDDIAPSEVAPAYATAELYDPVTGAWSRTGSMRYPRVGAPMVTLTDGRILIAGSRYWDSYGMAWNFTRPGAPPESTITAEIYDPATGRFSLTGELPEVNTSPISSWGPDDLILGVDYFGECPACRSLPGTLIALGDGGALLVGQVIWWTTQDRNLEGSIVRTLRLDPMSLRWTVADVSIDATHYYDEEEATPPPVEHVVTGHSRAGAFAVRLSDERVLVASGDDSGRAELYDPADDIWSALPAMPDPNADGPAVLLDDGTVLVIGNAKGSKMCALYEDEEDTCACGRGPSESQPTWRFFPGP